VQPPASRNALCPCGSGRRYKECHGALGPIAPAAPDPRLVAALAAQQAGRLDEAAAGYEAVLADAPDEFDALHMLGVVHFQRREFERALTLIDRALGIRPTNPAAKLNRGLAVAALERRPIEDELERDARRARSTPMAAAHSGDAPVRVIAFYLPQYHRIPENDAWWGEGFTEWTNVRRAQPVFAGHWQPHEPSDLGYYDLTDPATRAAQARLARAYGIDAFCYYHFWFGGKRLLERPLAEVLASGEPDFPFCVCWANENWTRRWDGLDQEVLMAQRYSREDCLAFIEDLYPLFRDRRYVRVDGRPLLLVYKIAEIPDVAKVVALWRDAARASGIGELYVAGVQHRAQDDPTTLGFDAAVEFPPIGHWAENITTRMRDVAPAFQGHVFDYRSLAAHFLALPRPAFRQFRGVTPMWDNTARRPHHGMIVTDSSPELFRVWLEHVLRQTMLRRQGEERLVFVVAWNEWAEGNHLEPDARYGRRYLEAVRDARAVELEAPPARPAFADVERATAALVASGGIAIERTGYGGGGGTPGERVSIVMPVYNHARYLLRTLASIAAQTLVPAELIAVDDGSSDDSAQIIAAFARAAPFPVTLARQPNAGAHEALNRGLALAREPTVALINSDDVFVPARLAIMTQALDDRTSLAFSDTDLIDDADAPASGAYATMLRERIDAATSLPDALYALVAHNIATSTGNLVFRRSLLGQTGGFAPLVMCHDWDFVLAATYATRVTFVRQRLYRYRLHGDNAFRGLRLAGHREAEIVLDRFFANLEGHPWLTPATMPAFLDHVRALGLGGYLRTPSSVEHPPRRPQPL
jgi:tetratricopeptide (TPR) repeat protein